MAGISTDTRSSAGSRSSPYRNVTSSNTIPPLPAPQCWGSRTFNAGAETSDSRLSISRMRIAAAIPDCSAVMFCVNSDTGPIKVKAYNRNAINVDTSIEPASTRHAPSARMTMIAPCTPVHPAVMAPAETRTAATACARARAALSPMTAPTRSSAPAAFTVRTERRLPSRTPPRCPSASWVRASALAIRGISTVNTDATQMIATMVTPSNIRSSTPISTMVPTATQVALMTPTTALDAASRSNTVSEVTRVTNSPTGRAWTDGTVDPSNRRTSDERAS